MNCIVKTCIGDYKLLCIPEEVKKYIFFMLKDSVN
ncbi:hypothetical protein B0H37_003703 [Clostridium beijerinckii]|nr:hypothetical protein [Clostridium beijerinckii]NOV71607.1 hypothetical protein [Clostridium beijerinckii]NOW32360.1 hypothetical protein [Clostridium beijerinckii]